MQVSDSALAAFQAAAGITPDKISLLIRTLLLSITFLWAAWCIYGEINHFRDNEIEIDLAIRKIFRVLFILTLITTLAFLS